MADVVQAKRRTKRLVRGLVAVVIAAVSLAGVAAAPSQAAATRLPVEQVRMLNYYPAGHGWAAMWTNWDAAEFDRDMTRVQALGGNAVRLILQTSAFGYPNPSAAMRAHLAEAVDIADRHGLAVQLTLFDWFSSFTDINGSKQWASAILAPYADDARVFSVELQNELAAENPLAVTWAAQMLPYLKGRTASPTTVSLNGAPARLATLKTQLGDVRPTFWSYHYYDQVLGAGANSAFAAAKLYAAPEPLYIGETGVDTELRPGEDADAAAARQDHFFRAVFSAARSQGLPVPAPWTLTDFVPGSYPGKPWAGQYSFGLYRLDGSAKPAAATVHQAFTDGPLGTSFNNSFENAGGTVPAEWTQYLPALTGFAVDTTTAHSGQRSARFTASLGDATGWPSIWTAPVQSIVAGQTYRASVWAKGQAATGVNRLGLSWYDAQGRFLGTTPSSSVVGTTGWTSLVATGAAPAGATIVAIHLQTTRNTGTVWFDDVTFD